MDRIKKFEPLFGNCYIDGFIGAGSYGRVYRIYDDELGTRFYSAVKFFSIPQDEGEITHLRLDGMNDESISAYFTNMAKNITAEIRLMNTLKGNTNIVCYEASEVRPRPDGIGYDIFIRMELLTSLSDLSAKNELNREEIVKIGVDICRALELCEKKKIIHRDIKPDNIFVNDNGDYKLGDFGVARQLERTATFMSKKGTYNYMAPEVYRGERYGAQADIYSLGLVLYRLLNDKCLPFLPPAQNRKYDDAEKALARRMSGEKLPLPANAQDELGAVIVKACEYLPENRYSTAKEMKQALLSAAEETTTCVLKTEQDTANANPDEDLQKDNQTKELPAEKPAHEPEAQTQETDEDRTVAVRNPAKQQFKETYEDNQEKGQILESKLVVNVFADGQAFEDESKAQQDEQSAKIPVVDDEKTVSVRTPAKQQPRDESQQQPAVNEQKSETNESKRKKKRRIILALAAAFIIVVFVGLAASGALMTLWVYIGTGGYVPPIDTPEPDVELITSADETSNTQMPSETMETQVVSFSNAAFEKAFREALSLADDEIITNDMLNSIKELDLSDKGLSNISDIEYFKELTMLSLRFNEISDISALGNLTNLQTLDLSFNEISDISALRSLTNLQTLYLLGNEISDISALRGLTNLQTLYLYTNSISDISALRSLTNLQTLSLSTNNISDISALGNLTNLESLDLSNNNISDISALVNLTNLESLGLDDNNISDISVLGNLTNLQTLNLCSNSISDISALVYLTNLESLYLDGNNIRNISALRSLTNLQTLYLYNNSISDISALRSLTNLEQLDLDANEISDISALGNLSGLSWLDLSNNNLTEQQVEELRRKLPQAEILTE